MSDFINLEDDLISRSKLLMHLNDYALQEAPFIEGQSEEKYNAIQNCMKAVEDAQAVEAVPLKEIYRVIAGHSVYHGDNILSALTCISEGKEVEQIKPVEAVTAAQI